MTALLLLEFFAVRFDCVCVCEDDAVADAVYVNESAFILHVQSSLLVQWRDQHKKTKRANAHPRLGRRIAFGGTHTVT